MFQPTDISGCLVYLPGDSIIGVRDGEDFVINSSQYHNWPNLGDSHIPYFTPASNLPGIKFHQNQLNGHATVEMSGGGGMVTPPLIIPADTEISAFYVFRDNQNIGFGAAFIFSQYGLAPGNLINTVTFASTLTFGNGWGFLDFAFPSTNDNQIFLGLNYTNDWIIRSDLVGQNHITLRRNSTVVGTGLFPTPLPNIGNGSFQIGAISYLNPTMAYSGEFAEIILYDHLLNDQQVNTVENYLKYKYFVGGGTAAPLTINGCNINTSGQYYPLVSLFTQSEPASGNMSLYIAQAYTISSGTPLYTAGVFINNQNTNLYTQSSPQSLSSGTLYTLGSAPNNSGISLYTQNAPSLNSNILLYTASAPSAVANTPLYVNGITVINSQNFPFYIQGLQNPQSSRATALFMAVNATSNTISNLYNFTSLTTYSATSSPTLPLYLQALSKDNQINNLNLFIKQTPTNSINTTSLFVQNSNIMHSGQTKLFIQGQGSLDGGLLDNSNMNLFIERWPAGAMTIFMNSAIIPSSTPLYIGSANTFTSGVPIILTGRNQLLGSGNTNLFLQSTHSTFTNTNMFISGIPNLNANTILYTNGF